MLAEPRLTLAVAESLTCGMLQALIGRESGASEYFLGGITAYTIEQKVRHLGVDRAEADAANAVSVGIARQMARGACEMFGAAIGAATTGYAEPAPARDVLSPFACWAVASKDAAGDWKFRSGRIVCPGMARKAVQGTIAAAVFAEILAQVREVRLG